MPTVVTTIEDTSPLIVYSGEGGYNDWKAGTSKDDSALDRYVRLGRIYSPSPLSPLILLASYYSDTLKAATL